MKNNLRKYWSAIPHFSKQPKPEPSGLYVPQIKASQADVAKYGAYTACALAYMQHLDGVPEVLRALKTEDMPTIQRVYSEQARQLGTEQAHKEIVFERDHQRTLSKLNNLPEAQAPLKPKGRARL